MSQKRIALALALIALVGAAAGCAGNQEDVNALNERVAALEQQIKQLQQAQPAGPNPALEKEAQAALNGVTALVAAGKIDEAKTKLASDSAKYSSTKYGRSFSSLSRELAVVGKAAPKNWGIEKWFQGEDKITLGSDDTTLVVFWETWCPHCRREVPKLQQIYADLNTQGLQVIGVTKVNRSSTEEAVSTFISENKLGYPIAKEDGSLSQYFNVGGIPAAAVVKGGKVVWRGHPARLTGAMLKGWIAS